MSHEHAGAIRRFIRLLCAFSCLFYREGGTEQSGDSFDFCVLFRVYFIGKGAALQYAVIRSLFNTDASGLCLVDKALSGLVFYDDRLAVFLNGEAVGLLIKEEALGGFGFLQCVIAVGQIIQFVDAVGQLLHLIHELSVTVYLKDRTAQMVVGIVFIHLGQLNAAANELVGDLNLDHSAVLVHLHSMSCLIQHISLRCSDFTSHIFTVGDASKGKAAVLCGNGGQDRLGAVSKEQTDGMVIETVYDTLAERYKSISLGQSKSSMITTISEVQSSVDKVESTVGRFPKLLQTAISKATGLITGQSGGYVVIHTGEENGQPYELLILDAPSIDDAVNVWRWNVGGLGFSHNGYNGPYETAITADGQIVADFITSGSLVANIIKAGVIQSQDGSSWWDLESGEVVLRAYATSKEVTEVSDRITNIEEQKMLRLVIISSNGNIFKNGNVKTLLSAKVYSWDEDITDTLDANQFIWTRVSEDTEADKVWNEQHFGGAKSVVITGADVKVRATFYCDLIDTTTRQSLL